MYMLKGDSDVCPLGSSDSFCALFKRSYFSRSVLEWDCVMPSKLKPMKKLSLLQNNLPTWCQYPVILNGLQSFEIIWQRQLFLYIACVFLFMWDWSSNGGG
jgi:hypothetical protein